MTPNLTPIWPLGRGQNFTKLQNIFRKSKYYFFESFMNVDTARSKIYMINKQKLPKNDYLTYIWPLIDPYQGILGAWECDHFSK